MNKNFSLGIVDDYFVRIEFQTRGSPNVHVFFWISTAPSLFKGSLENELIAYINKHIHTHLPQDNNPLRNLIVSRQMHKHVYCKTTRKQCRFNFPRPCCPKTRIRKHDEIRHNTNFYETFRPSGCEYLNSYHPLIFPKWDANIDIQMVNGARGLWEYVCKYISKTEPFDLKQKLLEIISKNISLQTTNVQKLLSLLTMCVLKHRTLSAQEAAYRTIGLPLCRFSRTVIRINTHVPEKRYKLLKPKKILDNLPSHSVEVFYDNVIDHYRNRPKELEDICLYDFATLYKIGSTST